MNKSKEKLPTIVPLSIFTTLTVILWIFFDVYRNFKKETAPVLPPDVTKTFDPNLDKEVLRGFSDKVYLTDDEIPQNTISVTPAPSASPRITSTPTATSSATPVGQASPTP